ARDMKIDQLKGYKLGASEYVTKPIDEELFLAKIEAILSRSSTNQSPIIEYKGVELNTQNSSLIVAGKTTNLSNRECDLLADLMRQPQQLIERNILLEKHWESTDEFSRNSMDVFISKLRKYLSSSDVEIRNVHGKGFILE
ncbi:MAG: winged helix-turn-helix domain-containing protein, partial [bacterium]|nr:winged helix-turn-helix domain-containing protein [bacterium]